MKHALVLEKDARSCARLSELLRHLGYTAATVRTAFEALEVTSAIKVEVIVTYTCRIPNDRRALTGELKRAAPEAALILIGENDGSDIEAAAGNCPGLSAIVTRPTSVDILRSIIALQGGSYGLPRGSTNPWKERRRQYS